MNQIPPTLIPKNPTLASYRNIWTIIPLRQHFVNSFLLGAGEVALVFFLGIPAAYALTRFRFAGRPEKELKSDRNI